jgi:outer membrane protein OmpA-like peptidoglycan-associated protein
MFIAVAPDGGADARLGAPPARYKPPFTKGGQAIGEGDARHLLTILAGPSSYQPYLTKAMARRATTVPSRFLRIVTSVKSQVPRALHHVFAGGGTVGGTIDRWTRMIYMVPAPGLRNETRLEYALHECVHLFADPHVPTTGQCGPVCVGTFQRTFGTGFGEGLTQVITEDILDTQGISRYYRDRPYDGFTEVMRDVVKCFGLPAMARAYFFGQVDALRIAMEVRWGMGWHAVAGATSSGDTATARARIRRLEADYAQRLQDMIRQAPKGDFPTPTKYRNVAGLGDPRKPPLLVFLKIDKFAVDQSALTPSLKQAVTHLADSVKASWKTMRPIGIVRLVGHTDASGTEQHNVGLGNRRAEAVRQELLSQLRGFRVIVDVEPSPGKSKPTANNGTAAGRAANRRVEVFVEPPFVATTRQPPTIPWPPKPSDPDRDGPWDPFRFKRGMPGPLQGKTPRQFLMDVCERRFGTGTCKTIVDRALSLGCKGIEALFERLGGSITGAQKEELRRQCSASADKPL